MSPSQTPRASRSVSACPWCGPGTELTLQYDTMGAVHLACTTCKSAGPKVEIESDFATAEEGAILAWSSRRQNGFVGRDTVSRVKLAVGLHCLTGSLTPDAAIGVAWSDLNTLLQSVTVIDRPTLD